MDRYCTVALVAVVCLVFVSSLVLLPNAFSQVNAGVNVLSYSWYVNPSGDFIVVGEVQNDGNSILQSVSLNATAYDSKGDGIAGNTAMAYVNYFLPQQKAPFYIDMGPATVHGDYWAPIISSVDFTVFNVVSTTVQEYGNLALTTNFNGTLNGPYDVFGFVSNIGNQTANGIKVVATYYNSSGTVVAEGFDIVSGSLPPYNATTFAVSEFDSKTSLVAQISSYSLLIQTSTLQNNTSLSSASPSPSSSSSAPSSSLPTSSLPTSPSSSITSSTSSPDSTPTAWRAVSTSDTAQPIGSSDLIYAVLGAVVIAVFFGAALVFLKKRLKSPSTHSNQIAESNSENEAPKNSTP
jgi:hypothetical protein